MTTLEKFEQIINSHHNGQYKQWKAQVKELSRENRAQLVDYVRDSGNEAMAFNIAYTIIGGKL